MERSIRDILVSCSDEPFRPLGRCRRFINTCGIDCPVSVGLLLRTESTYRVPSQLLGSLPAYSTSQQSRVPQYDDRGHRRDLEPMKIGEHLWKLWSPSKLANLRDGVLVIAFPLVAASLTRDPKLIAGLAIALNLPWLLLAVFSRAVVDRSDRRRVLYLVDAARASLLGLSP
jgi:hypothetical protein